MQITSFRWTEPLLLLLIVANVVILTIQSARDVFKHPRPASAGYFHEWEDYVIFVIFVIFTLEMLARILVSGFIFNAEESHRTRTYKDRLKRFKAKIDGKALHAPVMQRSTSSSESSLSVADPAPLDYLSTGKTNKLNDNHALGETEYEQGGRDAGESREQKSESPNYPPRRGEGSSSGKFASIKNKTSRYQDDVPFFQALNAQRAQHQKSNRKAYLRHSWNRIDFLAVTAFWLTFFLASTGLEYRHTLYIFRALAALRSARLLVITSGTAVRWFFAAGPDAMAHKTPLQTILRSLKQSAPLMVSVAFFVIFAMALFSIVGVYSFKGSFQRSCVWIGTSFLFAFISTTSHI